MMKKSERQRLMVMICLLACLPTSSYSFAQDGNPAVKTTIPIQMNFVYEMNLLPAGTFKLFATKSFGKVVKGAPYSATAITEHVQTLGDGNQIIRKNEAKVYRDSAGRTRLDQKLETIGKWTAAGDAPQMIYINDPVTGYSYNLDPRTRTVRKSTNVKTITLNQRLELTNERRRKEQEERAKEQEERVKEQAKEREIQAKERAKEQEVRAKERAKEQEVRAKERTKEDEARAKERIQEQQERMKEREKRVKQRTERIKEQTIERKERIKRIEKRVERPLQLKERNFALDSALKAKEETVRKEISSVDWKKKVESLGKQIIEGIEAEGTRSTRSIAAGEIGNTLPIEIIDESWHSTDLQVPVMTKHSDPRSGVTTYRLTNISRSEPQPSLFEIPADYTFQDESTRKRTVMKPEPPKAPEGMKKSEPSKPLEPTKKPEPPKAPVLQL